MMLIKPVITEKSFRIAAGDKDTKRQFSFYIDSSLNQLEAKKLIERVYKVNVLSSNISRKKGKKVIFKQLSGKSQDRKKMTVTLKPNQVIKAFELEEKKEEKK